MIPLFDQAALDRALAATIPSGDDQAVVLAVDLMGVKVAVHAELTDHWRVKGIYEHAWSGDNSLSGQLVYHWKG